ncbi:hypothetical protein PV325_013867 [Microctonus aethiopoides]|nr:hypothetical protein PV325_013867 [Microctonus aethiopoides]
MCLSPTVPSADHLICQKVSSKIGNNGEDHVGVGSTNIAKNVSTLSTVTKISPPLRDKQFDLMESKAMTTIKATPATGPRTSLPVLSHFKYEHLVAGVSGGVVSTLMLHPLDLIKIRFAVINTLLLSTVNDGVSKTAPQYSGLRNAIKEIVRVEGLRGLYRGVTPNVLGSGSSWGFYFFFYNSIKTWIQGGNSKKPLGPSLHMVAAADAGILTLLMTNPIWVVKTRLCLQYTSDIRLDESKRYSGMFDALGKIYRTEGVRGLYKGLVPGMFGVSHGAIQFMTYEEMKNRYNNYRKMPIDTKLATIEYIIFAAISKLIAAASTYPYQVVRARLQDHHHDYRGTLHCVQQIWRSEGLRGFYKGLSPGEGWRGFYKGLGVNLTRVTPATVITFVVYEHMSDFLLGMQRNSM